MTELSPRYVVQKAPGVGGNPIPEDERPIVIREQDRLAPFIITAYLSEYMDRAEVDPAVVAELRAHRAHCLEWQARHPELVKWADR